MFWFGFGVFKVENGSEVIELVKVVIKNGYCSIDIVVVYKNEEGVGIGIKEFGVVREEFFIILKVWNED